MDLVGRKDAVDLQGLLGRVGDLIARPVFRAMLGCVVGRILATVEVSGPKNIGVSGVRLVVLVVGVVELQVEATKRSAAAVGPPFCSAPVSVQARDPAPPDPSAQQAWSPAGRSPP